MIKQFVEETYERSGASKEEIEKFKEHNSVVLKYALELAGEEKLSQEDLEILKLAVALHDISKFDVPLVKHAFEGAKVAREILIKMGYKDEIVNKVRNAIERHIGQFGFMAEEAKKWEAKTGEKIEFPQPETKIEMLLHDADKLSLIDPQGIEKILASRKNVQIFQEEDKKTALEQGISQEEAAWLSALKSGREAADSLLTPAARKKAVELLGRAEKLFEEFLIKQKE